MGLVWQVPMCTHVLNRSKEVFVKTTYRIVDGFQCLPLGLILGFQLGVGVLVKFLEFLNNLQWTDERGPE